jgi:hypothetical protein
MIMRACILIAAAVAVSGCSEYVDRRDTLFLGAGEAVQTNIITHQIDPWPAHARSRDMPFNGRRFANVVDSYECPPAAGGGGAAGGAGGGLGGGGGGATVMINTGAGSVSGASGASCRP